MGLSTAIGKARVTDDDPLDYNNDVKIDWCDSISGIHTNGHYTSLGMESTVLTALLIPADRLEYPICNPSFKSRGCETVGYDPTRLVRDVDDCLRMAPYDREYCGDEIMSSTLSNR